MQNPFFYFAICGWMYAMIIHLFAVAGHDISNKTPFIWILYVGIFIVWIKAIFHSRKNYIHSSSNTLSSLSPNAPKWFNMIVIVTFYYAVGNFIYFFLMHTGSPEIKNGHYILESRGRIMKILTKQEYYQYKTYNVQGISGHLIAFYGFAAAILFPNTKSKLLVTKEN